VKTFKQFFSENKEYQVDDSQQEEYLEYQSEFVYDYEAMMGLPHDKLASIITKTGNKRFSATIDGVDPSVDGTEHYYVVTDRDVLKNIASLIASTGEPHHEEFAMDVGTGDSFEFMVRLPKSGFTGEEIGDIEVFLVAPGGSEQLQALLVDRQESGTRDKSDYKLYIDGEFAIKTSDKSRAEYLLKVFKDIHPDKKVELGGNVNENIGAGTKWVDGDVKITLQDVLDLASDPKQADPNKLKHLLIKTDRDPTRVDNADLSYPIVVGIRGGKPTKILDGQHRLVKAIKTQQPVQVRMLNLDVAPDHIQQMFGENFKDGKKKGKSRPGRVKRAGASCSGSVTSLRKKAKAGGEKGKMYHWCANMKSGKKK